jgi:hypothetical protein
VKIVAWRPRFPDAGERQQVQGNLLSAMLDVENLKRF